MCDNLYDQVHREMMHDHEPPPEDGPTAAEVESDCHPKSVSQADREAIERIMKEAERYGF